MIKIKKNESQKQQKIHQKYCYRVPEKKFKANNDFEPKKGKFASHFLEN